jgi:hypothetical protein
MRISIIFLLFLASVPASAVADSPSKSALDKTLGKITNRAEFLSAIKGHALAQGDLVGTYQKQASH